jgi:hypothetical protein
MSADGPVSSRVQPVATSALNFAESGYRSARALVPSVAEPYVSQLEETAISTGAPLLTTAQDVADKVLRSVDAQVESVLALHAKNMGTFTSAKEQYYGLVEAAVAQAKALLDPAAYVAWASEAVALYADPDKIVDTSFEVAGKVAAFGPVEKVLSVASPVATKTYDAVHDTLVTLPAYAKLWTLLFSVSSTLQESWAVKKFLEVGYPILAPVADPLVTNVTNSKYLKQLQSHLEPAKQA